MFLIEIIRRNLLLSVLMVLLMLIGITMLSSIAPYIFPGYLGFVIVALLLFFVVASIDFEVFSVYSVHFYIGSVIFLILPIFMGQVTRGAIRWIPIGALSVQPAEIVRPFLLLFIAKYYTSNENITLRRMGAGVVLFFIPLFLILVQPSLGVSALTAVGFVGVIFSLKFDKRMLIALFVGGALLLPVFWQVMEPYQRSRIEALINPSADPTGVGYNSIQSVVAVGSGRIFGRGLGEGVQTQLAFLPERHTDFIFAAISEELGFIGALVLLVMLFLLLYRVVLIIGEVNSFTARAFVSGVALTLFAQVVVHVGMNMALLPITGLPLPLVSAGGSSLLGTCLMLGMVVAAKS